MSTQDVPQSEPAKNGIKLSVVSMSGIPLETCNCTPSCPSQWEQVKMKIAAKPEPRSSEWKCACKGECKCKCECKCTPRCPDVYDHRWKMALESQLVTPSNLISKTTQPTCTWACASDPQSCTHWH